METKRLIVALVLSVLVLFGWTYFFAPPAPKSPAPSVAQTAGNQTAPAPVPVPAKPTPVSTAVRAAAQAPKITIKTPLYTARFNTQGGVLESLVLNKFHEGLSDDSPLIDVVGLTSSGRAALGLVLEPAGSEVLTWNVPGWTYSGSDAVLASGQKRTLVFSGKAAGLDIVRRITLDADSYLMTEETTVSNPGGSPVSGYAAYTVASAGLSPKGEDKYNPTRIAFGKVKGGFDDVSSESDLKKKGAASDGPVNWAAVESNYFLVAILPNAGSTQSNGLLKDGVYNLAVSQPVSIGPGQITTLKCSYYMGPAKRDILAQMPNKLKGAVNFGWFHFIAVPLLDVLNWFYKFVGNYGVAIILLTVLIKLLFWPLSQKSYRSMEQMKKIQPMIKKIRDKYGDDKEAMNREVMALYKTYKVNPAGGCLPMIVQIPVFFGLYKALLGSIELRHASFIAHLPFTHLVWLADLSAKDPYYITPLIMGATMFLQQKMAPASGDPTQAKIMLIMPVVFTFLFLNFPAGLVVYWLVNNILSIAQQWWMMRAKN